MTNMARDHKPQSLLLLKLQFGPSSSKHIHCGASDYVVLRMSKEAGSDTPAEPAFACGIEASALLNCVASKQYSEAKCKPLLQKLRSCVERKVSNN